MSLDFYLHYECDGNEISVFSTNVTHNLGKIAIEADIYYALWRPEEKGWKIAKDLIEPLTKGLADLKARSEDFKKLNPANGWGSYEHFVPFVEEVLAACNKYPSAIISVSR